MEMLRRLDVRKTPLIAGLAAAAVAGQAWATAILVFDANTVNGLAWEAAQNLAGAGAVKAGASDFYTKLAEGGWDVVAVDCPSTIPGGGWTQLADYVNAGGLVVMAYWNWDAEPGITKAFGASGTSGDVYWVDGSTTLTDMGTSPIFAGVSMPNSSWNNYWYDDGDKFKIADGSVGLAQIGGSGDPVMFLGNGGHTIASSVLDEAGPKWLSDGSGVKLWENMMMYVMPSPGALALLGLAGFAGTRRRR